MRARAQQIGWVLLPLRLFLGITMVYAGLLKLFDTSYLDPNSPQGVQQQMLASVATSPIGFLVTFAADHAAVFGLAIAFGELAVGIGVLLGLWTRVAATGGFLLSLSFLLTVSWGTTPYFLGPDLAYMFAFTPLMIGGDGGRYSLTVWIRDDTRRRTSVTAEVDRRVLLRTGATAAVIGLGAVVVGGIGRMVAGNSPSTAVPASAAAPAVPAASGGGVPAGGVQIGKASDVAVGSVAAFTNPQNNEPSFVLQPKAGTYLAYSGVCTHQGCLVGYDQARNQFVCPCHAATFDGSTGDVTRGPAKKPLAKINVVESGGNLYAV